jgi:hypothetical protein
MRTSVRVLIIDDESGKLKHVQEELDQLGFIDTRYVTNGEDAQFAMGSHAHIAIVQYSGDFGRQYKKTLLSEVKNPMAIVAEFDEKFEAYGTHVILVDVRSEEEKQIRDAIQGWMWHMRYDMNAIISAPKDITAIVFSILAQLSKLSFTKQRFSPPKAIEKLLLPQPPTPKRERPARFENPDSKYIRTMSKETRDAFEAFKAGREARQ